MANNIIKRVWNQNRMVSIEDLTGAAFQAESGGHTFEISGIDDTGAAVALSGTVAGVFRRPDNADIALTGSASGGVVSVTLSDDCYAVPGRFGLTIFVTSNGQKVAVYACVGSVAVTSGGGVAGDTPQDVVDLINAIEAAVATIPASYTSLMAAVAPTYSNSSLYAVGSYAWYNGTLYRCVLPITTAESFTAAHWKAVSIGGDLAGVKGQLQTDRGHLYNTQNLFDANTNGVGSLYINGSGVLTSIGSYTPCGIAMQAKPSTKYRISCAVASHKRVGTFTNNISAGRTATNFVAPSEATADDIFITTGANDHYIFVQIFTTADPVQTVESYYSSLVVAEATGEDNVSRRGLTLEPVTVPGITWEQGSISSANGNDTATTYQYRTGLIDSDDLPDAFLYDGEPIIYRNGSAVSTICFIYEYARNATGSASFLRRISLTTDPVYHRSPDAEYVRFTCGVGSSSGVTMAKFLVLPIFSLKALPANDFESLIPRAKSWRLANSLARMRQMVAIGYTPVGTIPNQSSDMTPGSFYHGVPYSSVRALDTFIGIDVSPYTFATMVHNPHSVLYTRKSTNTNSKTYVGVVCSSMVCYLLGLSFPLGTDTMADSPDFIEKDFWTIEPGDILVNADHSIFITDVLQDKYGRVQTVGVAQASPPRAYYRTYTADGLNTFMKNNGYKLYRFAGDSDYGYEPCPFVRGFLDETLDETVPDIMTEYGDRAVIKAGTDVLVNVLSSTGYSSIKVYKNDTLVDTKAVADFTLSAVEYGTWKVELVGDGVSSFTEFIAVDTSGCSYDPSTKILTFASANATLVGANSYGDGGGCYKNVYFSAADITRGTKDVSGLVTETYPYMRVVLRTQWGQTAWRSYDLHKWVSV